MPNDLFDSAAATRMSATAAQHALSANAQSVAQASTLLWNFRTQTELGNFLAKSSLLAESGKRFTAEVVKSGLTELRRKGLLVEYTNRPGYFHLADALRVPIYREWLDAGNGKQLVAEILNFEGISLPRLPYYWASGKLPAVIALVRAMLLSGADSEALRPLRSTVESYHDWSSVLTEAVLVPFDAQSFQYINLQLRDELAYGATFSVSIYWREAYLPVVAWATKALATRPTEVSNSLRFVLAELALQQGNLDLLKQATDGMDNGFASAVRAGLLVLDGQWEAGQKAFEAAIKQRQNETGSRKYLLSASLAWLYPLALLAQGTPKHLELARKYCAAESGKRDPSAHDPWGCWVNAIDCRLGKTALVKNAFSLEPSEHERVGLGLFWRVLLAAWLGLEVIDAPKKTKTPAGVVSPIELLRRHFDALKLVSLRRQLDGADTILNGGEPPAGFFIASQGERWRDVLTALQALGAEAGGGDGSAKPADTQRVVWQISIGKHGELLDIKPLEQKRSARGWNTPKALSLSKLAANQDLPPWDTKVARCLHADRSYANRFYIDHAAAIVALVGHPALVLEGAPGQLVDLVETPPELEVVRRGGEFVMQMTPPLRPEPEGAYYYDAESRRVLEALRLITLLIDSPQRLRLVRYSAAQRRAAQMVSGRFTIPASDKTAQAELQKTLQALSGHFQVNADSAQASRQVPAESRLRAELAPVGDFLSLRLVVAPLGSDGPRHPVASGRVRLMATIGTETVGTQRDLALEKQHLDAVLDAFSFLDTDEAGQEWVVEDPEQALELVEVLPKLPAIAAVDWPKGKKIRVVSVETGSLGIKVSRERDWFRVSGQAGLDEGLVLQLETLITAAREKSRFIPMGDGVYAALTRSLKQKLLDLAAVAESDKQGSKVPQIAAAWLDEILDGADVDASPDFRRAIERLRSAQAENPVLPKSLQAELRSYQEEGYQWAMRLAAAGMGGCLADDMGLGKTLQALAVMLKRAAGGPTLVIAPTSVCGNWLAEASRFAPSLNVRIYSEASESERETLVTQAGPQDVLIVSYTLLQLAQERFAAHQWHTLVADEAQAIKNAAAKRSQAVFDLPADFRLALSGTPVENRLTELWSIMRFVNPGLLGTLARFNQRFATPIERNRDRDAQHVLKRLISPFVMRRTKGQVLQDLPPRTELLLSVVPEAAEAAHYEALRRIAMQEVSELSESAAGPQAGQARFNILAQLTKLRRAACDPRLSSPEFGIAGAKVQAFAELATELTANGHKTLVFSQFVDFLQILRAPLDAAGISYQYLDGATPAAERSKRVAAFQAGEGDLFLISLKAGGFGLNLTAADYVVITDPWWNPAAEDQAMGRAHRIGQLRPVTVYRLVSKGTIEERIVDLHHDKRALADSILDDGDASALPSTEDLVALIRGD
ncbi:MAG: SNF2-related protein [Rhodocyclaceae bacterium]|nr:SNF2-related protein [Rhodocyclaceae bacterium]